MKMIFLLIGKLYIKIRKIVLNTNNKSLSLKRRKNQKLESQRNYQKNNSMIITHNLLIENNNPITKNSEVESIQLPLINKINLLKLNKPISQKKIKNNSDSTTTSIKKLKIKKKIKKYVEYVIVLKIKKKIL